MATKPNESINGRYFYRWGSEEGQQAIAIANKALSAAGIALTLHYEAGMVPGLLGDLTPEAKEADQVSSFGVDAAAQADADEQRRQQKVREAIAAVERKAAENGK